jgi:predicted Zn-dependent protease
MSVLARCRWLVTVAVLTQLAVLPAAATATVGMEKQLGEDFVIQARKGLPLIYDYEINEMVSEIGGRIVRALGMQPFDYEFFVVRDDSINAFAVPGGKVFVHAGLISRVKSEDALAGVLAHEVAHAHAHHAVRQQQKGAAAGYASLAGIFLALINPVLGQAALMASQAKTLEYQRDFEREADFLALEYTRRSGFDPQSMLELLRVIYDEQKINPTSVPPYFLSHPLTAERMANIEAALGRLEWERESAPVASKRLLLAAAVARGTSQRRAKAVGDYEAAVSSADAGEERLSAVEMAGVLMVHGEDYSTALAYLREAVAGGRDMDRELGRTLLRLGEYDEALPLLKRAVEKRPGDWDALADLGEAHYRLSDAEQAVAALEKSWELSPWRPRVAESFARALDQAGKRERGYYFLAVVAETTGRLDRALLYYRKALPGLEEGGEEWKQASSRLEQLEDAAGQLHRRPRPPVARPRRLSNSG